MKCQLLLIGHYFVESWSDKSTYLFPFWLSVSLILPTTSCIVYQALHCCSMTHSIVNTGLCTLWKCSVMRSMPITWEFCAVTFAYVQLILPIRFHFMRYFVNSIIFRVFQRLLYCVFIEVDFENRNCQKYSYFFKSKSILKVKLSM